jgi:hypothetical protein
MVYVVSLRSFRPQEYVYEGGILITSPIWMSTRLLVISENIIFFGAGLPSLRV